MSDQTESYSCEYINKKSVKALAKSCENQTSPEFIQAFDGFVATALRRFCKGWGAKRRLTAAAITGEKIEAATAKPKSEVEQQVAKISYEAIVARKRGMDITVKEHLDMLALVISTCDSILKTTKESEE